MKKKVIILSAITGTFMLGLCAKLIIDNRDVPVMENAAAQESGISDGSNECVGQEKTESAKAEEVQPENVKPEGIGSEETPAVQESERQNKITIPEKIDFVEPIVKWNDEKGILDFYWDSDCIRVDADTLLFVIDCYFAEEKLQQKIFFLAQAPDFMLREVFRQDSKIWDEELKWPERLERRISRPYSVDGGYVYELDGVLYFLTGDFKEASPLCDLRELMGDYYSFSVGIAYRTCDVTADGARLVACTDEGLYEYELENGNRKLLESAYFAPHEINEEDCLCGQRDFSFAGPVKVEYGPDEQSYAFLTGTEEADWGDITGVVLCSGEGEILYQKESDHVYDVYDFKWVESEGAIYFASFYTEKDEKGISDVAWLMDRVDISTKEVVTFEVPKEIYSGGMMCCIVGFLNADTLFYINYDKPSADKDGLNNKDIFEVYRLSSGERQDLEVTGDADWEMIVFDMYDYGTIPVRYPK